MVVLPDIRVEGFAFYFFLAGGGGGGGGGGESGECLVRWLGGV